MNKVMLIGRIANDIELRSTESGIKCVSINIALNNGKDKEGNERKADFPKVVVYNEQADNLAKYQKKGNLIAVEGRIKTRSWDKQDGTKGYETYVMADRIEFLQTKPKEEAPLPEPDYVQKNNAVDNQTNDPFAEFGQEADLSVLNEVDVNPDDLPF